MFVSKERFVRLSCEAGLGDCPAEARRAPRRGTVPLRERGLSPFGFLCLCGEYFFTGNPEEPKQLYATVLACSKP